MVITTEGCPTLSPTAASIATQPIAQGPAPVLIRLPDEEMRAEVESLTHLNSAARSTVAVEVSVAEPASLEGE